jgi:hypothetical protein
MRESAAPVVEVTPLVARTEMKESPGLTPVIRPRLPCSLLTVTAPRSLDTHVTSSVASPVVPSENVAVALMDFVSPTRIRRSGGVTRRATIAPRTVRMPGSAVRPVGGWNAPIWVPPMSSALTRPASSASFPIDATPRLLDDHSRLRRARLNVESSSRTARTW